MWRCSRGSNGWCRGWHRRSGGWWCSPPASIGCLPEESRGTLSGRKPYGGTLRRSCSYAVFSILASAVYLVTAQNLFLPREEKRFHTEHLAAANVAIFLTILVATLGLFLMVGLLMLGIQLFIFPVDLVREWPSLELDLATVTLADQVRIAGLISTIGVLTGALGGGVESRDVIRHLALFGSEP